jgi:hypothetical protein
MKETRWIGVVMPMRDPATGRIKVPDCECIAEYIMVMAIGDTKARPKKKCRGKYKSCGQRETVERVGVHCSL